MRTIELAVRGERVLTPRGMRPATVLIGDGVIIDVVEDDSTLPGCPVLEAGAAAVLPGLVDSHVHVNEPGRTEWEGFATATRAAAAGGVTTIVDMPLNCIPVTTTRAALDTKRDAVGSLLSVDCAYWGGLVPGNLGELGPLIESGVVGFKAFLVHSGIDDFPQVGEAELRAAMPVLGRRGVPLIVHAELELEVSSQEAGADPGKAPSAYASWLASRPREMENRAIRMMIELCRETRCPVHIVHLSSAEALDDIAAARKAGLPLSAETCPHYLTFSAEEIPDGRTEYKCAPPIRETENRERLWSALKAGTIDMVVSDHSPCTPALKCQDSGDFMAAWGGVASLQFGLSATWTGARARGMTLTELVRWMCERPAKLAGLWGRKGAIAPGYDADLVLFRPEASFMVEPEMIQHRHKLTPYVGRKLIGVVERTILRGETVYHMGKFPEAVRGRHLRRVAPSRVA
jgi:allantoinase